MDSFFFAFFTTPIMENYDQKEDFNYGYHENSSKNKV